MGGDLANILATTLTPLIFGSYVYTYYSINSLWKVIEALRKNELRHLEQRLDNVEERIRDIDVDRDRR